MSGATLTDSDARTLQDCLAAGGVAVFPADTVYGLACDPNSPVALERLYELKGRPPAKPAAVMCFSLAAALGELEELPPRTRLAVKALLPGPVTLLLPNPRRRFPLACEPGRDLDPQRREVDTQGLEVDSRRRQIDPPPLGLRVPAWPASLSALQAVQIPALQSSANLSGDPAPHTLAEVPESIRRGADMAIDGGELPGVSSTVIDLTRFEMDGGWSVPREGALAKAAISRLLADIGLR